MTPHQEAVLNNRLENSIETWKALKDLDAEMRKTVPNLVPVGYQLRHLKSAEASHTRTVLLRDALVTSNEHDQDKPVIKRLLAHLNERVIWEEETLGFWRAVLKSNLS